MSDKNSIQDDLIREELKRTGGNFSKVARTLGLDFYSFAKQYRPMAVTPFVAPTGPEPEDIRVLGKEGFRGWVIAVKRGGSAWPEKYAAVLQDARDKFDNGTHEMFQTNTRGWVVQYLIPRKRSIQRKPFFREVTV